MARYTGPVLKKCRSLGIDPICLGIDKKSNKNLNNTKNKKVSEYGLQLREKQKAKFIYGVLERQFRKYYEEAERQKGVTGTVLLSLLERRLDNVVFRLGIGSTRQNARQIVTHGHITVNGKAVNIASYQVKQNDVIAIKESSKDKFKDLKDLKIVTPKWLEFSTDTLTGKVLALPQRDDIDFNISEHLIIELYSK